MPTYEEYVEKKEKAGKEPLSRVDWERRVGLKKDAAEEAASEETPPEAEVVEEVAAETEAESVAAEPKSEEVSVTPEPAVAEVVVAPVAEALVEEPVVEEPPGPKLPFTVSGGILLAQEDLAFRKLTASLNYIKRNSNEATWDRLKVATVHLANLVKKKTVVVVDLESSILEGLEEASKGKPVGEVETALKSARKYCLKLVEELRKR